MNVFFLFRFSLIAPAALSAMALLYAYFAESTFSQDWQDLLAWNGDGGIIPDDPETTSVWAWVGIGIILLVIIIALLNQILLFFYCKPARKLYLWSCVLGFPITLFLGLSILTPVECFLYEISYAFSGMTLALLYYSPVAERFATSHAQVS